MPKIDPDACPERSGTRYPEPYRATVKARRWKQIAAGAGLADFGANLVTIPPGSWSSQRHWHDDDDELLMMVSGELVLIEDAGRIPLGPGDIAAWPKGTGDGHHLVNESAKDACFLVIGGNKGGAGYSDIDLVVRADEDFYRHKDGTPHRVWTAEE